jgi:hypothetical protein
MSDDEMVTVPRAALEAAFEAAQRGDVLAGWISATAQLGHASPGMSLDYMPTPEPFSAQAFVHDFVAWTSGRKSFAPGCEERLRKWGIEEARLRTEEFLKQHRPDKDA